MVFNINEIKSNINRHGGVARPNLYSVKIPTSTISGLGSEDLSLFCESSTLPGLNYQTNEFRYTGYGMVDKRPYMASVTDASMIFFLDADSDVTEHFQKWLKLINSFNNEEGDDKDMFSYPDEYVVDIDIEQYKSDETISQTYKLIRAFPLTISDVTISWAEKNSIMKLPVQFAFQTWTSSKL